MTRGTPVGSSVRMGQPSPADLPAGDGSDVTSTLFYLYGLLEQGNTAHRMISGGGIFGMEEQEPVFAVEASGLVAAVSKVPSSKFESAPLNKALGEISTAAPLAARHDGVIRALLDTSDSIVPVTLGTVFKSLAPIEQLLQSESERINILLRKLRGKQEWGVKVFEHMGDISDQALLENDDLRELDRQISTANPGRAFLLSKRRQQLVASATTLLRQKRLNEVVALAEKMSVATRRDKLVQPPDQYARLALKLACLVNRGDVDRFVEAVEGMRSSLEPFGLDPQVTGPWAPYSFADVSNAQETGPASG